MTMTNHFQVKLDDEMIERLEELIPYGLRSALIRTAVTLILDFVDKSGDKKDLALGMAINGGLCLAARAKEDCSNFEQTDQPPAR